MHIRSKTRIALTFIASSVLVGSALLVRSAADDAPKEGSGTAPAKSRNDGSDTTLPEEAKPPKGTAKKTHPAALANTLKGQGNVLPKPPAPPRKHEDRQVAAKVATGASPGPAANLNGSLKSPVNGLNPRVPVLTTKALAPAVPAKPITPLLPIAAPHRLQNPAMIGGTIMPANNKNSGAKGTVALGRP